MTNTMRVESSEGTLTAPTGRNSSFADRRAWLSIGSLPLGSATRRDESDPTLSFAAATTLSVDASAEDSNDPSGSAVQPLIR